MTNSYYEHEARSLFQRPRITWAVQRLILANAAVYAVQLVLNVPFGGTMGLESAVAPPGGFVADWLAFQPTRMALGALWQPFTYMFVHAGLMHLFFNMLMLFFFGPEIERVLGTRQFVRFYVLCGALAVLATFLPLILLGSRTSVAGASGAIMAVMVAFAIVNPERQIFLFPLPIPINARALIIILIAMNILNGLQPGSGTSVATHFGGMAAGYAYMKLAPLLRARQRAFWRNQHEQTSSDDQLGEAIDNIFRFEDKKRPR